MTFPEYQPDYPFISQNVLERLISGDFKPVRSKKSLLTFSDRRDRISPLGVIKRAIRYEPNVFINRRRQVFDVANALNNPEFKIIALYGQEGIGKTALARAVVEMMGGTPAQLLWYDSSPLTDIEQMSRFCVEYLLYICRSLRSDLQFKEALNPRETLRILLSQIPDIPILLVIDNIELYVSDDLTWRAPELHEMIQYLLEFDNIKLMLLGQHLPENDLRQRKDYLPMPLAPLRNENLHELVQEHLPGLDTAFESRFDIAFLHGNPEWFWVWARLQQQNLQLLIPETEQNTIDYLTQVYLNQCSPAELPTACLLGLVRHGVHQTTYDDFVRALDELLPKLETKTRFLTSEQFLDSSLRWISKKAYSPQSVLGYVRQRIGLSEDKAVDNKALEIKGVEPYYVLVSGIAASLVSVAEPKLLSQLHLALAQFYDAEQQRPIHQRIFPLKTRVLTLEAEYHRDKAKRVLTKKTVPLKETPVETPVQKAATVTEFPVPKNNAFSEPKKTEETTPHIVIQTQNLDERVSYYQSDTGSAEIDTVEDTLEHYYTQGVVAYEAGHLSEAKVAFQHWLAIETVVLETHPEKAFKAYLLLADASLQLGKQARAIYYLEKSAVIQHRVQDMALKVFQSQVWARYWLENNNFKKAVNAISKAIRISRQYGLQAALADNHLYLAEVLLMTHHVVWGINTLVLAAQQYEAIMLYDKALSLWIRLTIVQQRSGSNEMAILNIKQALRLAHRSSSPEHVQFCETMLSQLLAQSEASH